MWERPTTEEMASLPFRTIVTSLWWLNKPLVMPSHYFPHFSLLPSRMYGIDNMEVRKLIHKRQRWVGGNATIIVSTNAQISTNHRRVQKEIRNFILSIIEAIYPYPCRRKGDQFQRKFVAQLARREPLYLVAVCSSFIGSGGG